jgi:hypothetical protein
MVGRSLAAQLFETWWRRCTRHGPPCAAEIDPKVFALDGFAAKARSESFLRDVLSRLKISLIGSAHDLEELAGHRP